MAKKYNSFASYLEDVYYNDLSKKIKSYLYHNKGYLNLSTRSIPDPSYATLDDFHVMSVIFHEAGINRISCKATIQADIEISGRGRYGYESDSTQLWVSIPISGILNNGFQYVRIGEPTEYPKTPFIKKMP